jgi:hypothetical protein
VFATSRSHAGNKSTSLYMFTTSSSIWSRLTFPQSTSLCFLRVLHFACKYCGFQTISRQPISRASFKMWKFDSISPAEIVHEPRQGHCDVLDPIKPGLGAAIASLI